MSSTCEFKKPNSFCAKTQAYPKLPNPADTTTSIILSGSFIKQKDYLP